MSEHDELLKDFLLESYENLDRLDRDLVELEKSPDDRETISSIFRTIHTIKGTCGFLGLHKLESVTHVGENLLSRLRDGELKLNSERTTGMLAMVDATRQILRCIETAGNEGTVDYTDLVRKLTQLKDGAEGVFTEGSGPALTTEAEPAGPKATGSPEIGGEVVAIADIDAALDGSVKPVDEVDVDSLSDEASSTEHVAFAKPAQIVVDGKAVAPRSTISEPVPGAVHGGGGEADAAKGGVADTTIRIDVTLLDRLMNLVGELVLTRNQIIQYSSISEHTELASTTQRLNHITSELQEGVMKTRMQPINVIWQKFPRVIRDLSGQLGKSIKLEMLGKETELDKTIIEAIKDPLTHIIRNSVDHGVETSAKRLATGKSAEGTVRLRAFHEGGLVNIEISDDGAGIDPAKLRAKAVSKALITQEQADRLSDREAINLIFLPGFSTAEKVTNVSGRGVGMDVVRTNIEKIGGSVDIQSVTGSGTTLLIKIPLTLAIIPALLISAGNNRFAIPQVSLLELLRLEPEQAREKIEYIHGAPVYRLRGNLLPLSYLNDQLGLPRPSEDAVINIVVLQADGRSFGLIVDQINDTEEIVVKPLGKQLKPLTKFAGATIMGDGQVALILDVMGLAKAANINASKSERAAETTQKQVERSGEKTTSLLLVTVGGSRRMAIPLEHVARLEEVKLADIEHEGRLEVVQYRGRIMPLVRLEHVFSDTVPASYAPSAGEDGSLTIELDAGGNAEHGPKTTDIVNVVVHNVGQHTVGIVVDQILDVAEEHVNLDSRRHRRGLIGSAVVQGRVTEIVDLDAVVGDVIDLSSPGQAPAIAA